MELTQKLFNFLKNNKKFTFNDLISSQDYSVERAFSEVKLLIGEGLIKMDGDVFISEVTEKVIGGVNDVVVNSKFDGFSKSGKDYLGVVLTHDEISLLEFLLNVDGGLKENEFSGYKSKFTLLNVLHSLYRYQLIYVDEEKRFHALCSVSDFEKIKSAHLKMSNKIDEYFKNEIKEKVDDEPMAYEYFKHYYYECWLGAYERLGREVKNYDFSIPPDSLKTDEEYILLRDKFLYPPDTFFTMFLLNVRMGRIGLDRFFSEGSREVILVNEKRREFCVTILPEFTGKQILLKAVQAGASKNFILPDFDDKRKINLKNHVQNHFLLYGYYDGFINKPYSGNTPLNKILNFHAGLKIRNGEKIRIFFRFI